MSAVMTAGELRTWRGTEVGKRLATLQAHCALDGVELHRIENDRGYVIYVVTKGPMTRELRDLEAVEQWLGHGSRDASGLPAWTEGGT